VKQANRTSHEPEGTARGWDQRLSEANAEATNRHGDCHEHSNPHSLVQLNLARCEIALAY
jgi:hypothetical protein